ncbi:MAG TPA: hypothetical protein VGD40_26270 [Chryseosolibacter sp.]
MDTARLFTMFFFFVVFGAFAEYEAGRRLARSRPGQYAKTKVEKRTDKTLEHRSLSRLRVGLMTNVSVEIK